jgi:sigma54-dependent transcription regulator
LETIIQRYQTEQNNNKTTLSESIAAARTGKNRLIEQAKRQGRVKRAAIKLTKGQRVNKKILYTLVNKTLQSDIEKIRNTIAKSVKH